MKYGARPCLVGPRWAPFHSPIELSELTAVRSPAAPQFGWTALHFAAQNGHAEVVEKLVSANCDKDAKTNVRRPTLPRPSMGAVSPAPHAPSSNCLADAAVTFVWPAASPVA